MSAIQPLILCRGPRCIGKTGELDPDCTRCGGIDSLSWGIDPVSLRGCVEEHDYEAVVKSVVADDDEEGS